MHDMGTCVYHPSATAQVCTPEGHQTALDHGPSHKEEHESSSAGERQKLKVHVYDKWQISDSRLHYSEELFKYENSGNEYRAVASMKQDEALASSRFYPKLKTKYCG